MFSFDSGALPILAKHLAVPPPSRLYHYTSTDGFRGIVESHEMWATDVFYMNDAKEFLHAIELLQQAAATLVRGNLSEPQKKFLIEVGSLARQEAVEQPHIFAISFSAVRDQLSQWRAYSRAGGYALAFESQAMKQIAMSNELNFIRCVYDRDEQIAIVEEYLNAGLQLAGNENVASLAKLTLEGFFVIASMMKHPGYSEESEWRLVSDVRSNHVQNVQFRSSARYLIPFISVKIGGGTSPDQTDKRSYLGFDDVLVAPAPEPELSWRSCMQFLHGRSVFFRQITPSVIPYRANS